MVADPESCNIAPCSFAVSRAVTVSTTFSTSSTTTITNSVGTSLSVEAGEDFILEAKVTTSFQYEWAKSVAEETGTAITQGTTTTVTNTLGFQPGTKAFVTFTPTYECWPATVACDGGSGEASMNFCQPQYTEDGQSLQGDYTVVYTS